MVEETIEQTTEQWTLAENNRTVSEIPRSNVIRGSKELRGICLKIGIDFDNFGLKLAIVFKGNTRKRKRIYLFIFKPKKEKQE